MWWWCGVAQWCLRRDGDAKCCCWRVFGADSSGGECLLVVVVMLIVVVMSAYWWWWCWLVFCDVPLDQCLRCSILSLSLSLSLSWHPRPHLLFSSFLVFIFSFRPIISTLHPYLLHHILLILSSYSLILVLVLCPRFNPHPHPLRDQLVPL